MFSLNFLKNASFFSGSAFFLLLNACFLENPAKETEEPSELEYNYWLLDELYYFDSLPELSGICSTKDLYDKLEDPWTLYFPKEEASTVEESINTSFIPGSIGIELYKNTKEKFPLFIYRIYENSPAFKQKVPKNANLLSINHYSLAGENAPDIYQEIFEQADSVILKYVYAGDTSEAHLKKEKLLTPTVFLDTLSDLHFLITIRSFTKITSHPDGTVGELKAILEKIETTENPVIIDIRNNPGGFVLQCKASADLFIDKGILFQIQENQLFSDGKARKNTRILKSSDDFFFDKPLFVFSNEKTGSCAELFELALITNNTKVETFGTTTFGKGVGQSIYQTKEGGRAHITSMLFFDKNGKTYHNKGIFPKIPCDNADYNCFSKILQKITGNKILTKKQNPFLTDSVILIPPLFGGALFTEE